MTDPTMHCSVRLPSDPIDVGVLAVGCLGLLALLNCFVIDAHHVLQTAVLGTQINPHFSRLERL